MSDRRHRKRYRAHRSAKQSISVSAAAHAALKALAESEGKSMRQVVEEWVEGIEVVS